MEESFCRKRSTVSDEEAPHERSTKTKKSKKPDGQPHRPLSSYNFFFKAERVKLLLELEARGEGVVASEVASETSDEEGGDTATAGDKSDKKATKFYMMGKVIGQRWKALSAEQREEYEQPASEDMKRYRREMEKYTENMIRSSSIGKSAREHAEKGGEPKLWHSSPSGIDSQGQTTQNAAAYTRRTSLASFLLDEDSSGSDPLGIAFHVQNSHPEESGGQSLMSNKLRLLKARHELEQAQMEAQIEAMKHQQPVVQKSNLVQPQQTKRAVDPIVVSSVLSGLGRHAPASSADRGRQSSLTTQDLTNIQLLQRAHDLPSTSISATTTTSSLSLDEQLRELRELEERIANGGRPPPPPLVGNPLASGEALSDEHLAQIDCFLSQQQEPPRKSLSASEMDELVAALVRQQPPATAQVLTNLQILPQQPTPLQPAQPVYLNEPRAAVDPYATALLPLLANPIPTQDLASILWLLQQQQQQPPR